jgi:uncharacterized protein
MSEENVEIVRSGFAAIGRGDWDAMSTYLAPDFEYVPSGTFVGVRETSAGPDGFRHFLESFWAEFDQASIQAHEFIDAGDDVVTRATFSGRGTHSGAETSLDLWILWTLRRGKLIRGRAFQTRVEALEAAGMSR